jgi:hypothetical protein
MNTAPLQRVNDGRLEPGPRFLIVRIETRAADGTPWGAVVATARHLEIAWDLAERHAAIIIDKAHDQVIAPRPVA